MQRQLYVCNTFIMQHYGTHTAALWPPVLKNIQISLLSQRIACPALCYCTLKISPRLVIGACQGISLPLKQARVRFSKCVNMSGWLHMSQGDQVPLYQLRIGSYVFKNRLMREGPIHLLKGSVTYFCSSPLRCSGKLCWVSAS